eukprot:CAMPEP_0174273286 /NCGR_PEP_ID=MMETSP0439-20130205/54005_1 /TAXON_ID=0 /ORGANISM="Stereomyxa ramosa, Strain Chinc5" /LENGTH=325 /DNA_ID=CAMNT_0015364343 /DNA_START=30 /DNA_END=1004 /DNA_ORIENTATION=+
MARKAGDQLWDLVCARDYEGLAEFLTEESNREGINRRCGRGLKPSLSWTLLHYACYHGLPCDLVQLLIDAGADVNRYSEYKERDRDFGSLGCDYRTPLQYACERGHAHLVPLLLKNGAKKEEKTWDIFLCNCCGLWRSEGGAKTPLQLALQGKHQDVVDVLNNVPSTLQSLCLKEINFVWRFHNRLNWPCSMEDLVDSLPAQLVSSLSVVDSNSRALLAEQRKLKEIADREAERQKEIERQEKMKWVEDHFEEMVEKLEKDEASINELIECGIYPWSLVQLQTRPLSKIIQEKADITKLEVYVSPGDFEVAFGMSKDAFYQLPPW